MAWVGLEQQLHGAIALPEQHETLGAATRVLDAAPLPVVKTGALQLAPLQHRHLQCARIRRTM